MILCVVCIFNVSMRDRGQCKRERLQDIHFTHISILWAEVTVKN